MKVMSYNIQHGEGLDGVLSLSRIAKNILNSDASIIGIQEIDKFFGERSDYKDQAKQLAEKMQFNYTYGTNINLPPSNGYAENRQYGTAIFSRYPILESENTQLTSYGKEPRGLLKAKIDVEGVHVNIYNTHLGLDKKSKTKQIQEIIEITSKDKGPYVLMGDFNAEPRSEELCLLKNETELNDVFESISDANTYLSLEPTQRIDYIFVSSQIKYKNSKVLQVNGSDHLPIVSQIETPLY